jgi:hypothetical protein
LTGDLVDPEHDPADEAPQRLTGTFSGSGACANQPVEGVAVLLG